MSKKEKNCKVRIYQKICGNIKSSNRGVYEIKNCCESKGKKRRT